MATKRKPPTKPSGPQEVAAFLARLDHPLRPTLEAVRALVLGVDRGITEHIKWNAPSFCIDGEDRVTCHLHRKRYLLIVFHKGAKAKERHGGGPFFTDDTGLLQWLSDDRAIVTLHSRDEFAAKQAALRKVVKTWISRTRGRS